MKVIVQHDWGKFTTRFYIQNIEAGKMKILGINKNDQLIWQDVDEASVIDVYPLLELSNRFGEIFIKGIVDYASNEGIKTINENLLQGKLQATEKHLEDTRVSFTKVLDKLIEIKFTL